MANNITRPNFLAGSSCNMDLHYIILTSHNVIDWPKQQLNGLVVCAVQWFLYSGRSSETPLPGKDVEISMLYYVTSTCTSSNALRIMLFPFCIQMGVAQSSIR